MQWSKTANRSKLGTLGAEEWPDKGQRVSTSEQQKVTVTQQ